MDPFAGEHDRAGLHRDPGQAEGLAGGHLLAERHRVRQQRIGHGDVGATSSSGSTTNKDKDGDFNTVTQSDRLGVYWGVFNHVALAQTIRITVVLDGPGTTGDMTFVDEDRFFEASGDQGCDIEQDFTRLQVKHQHFPAGTYSWSVTGSGSESVTATSTFTIDYGKE